MPISQGGVSSQIDYDMHLKQLVLRPSTGELRLVGKEWESEVERDRQHSKVSTFFTPSEVGRKEPAPSQVGCLQSAYVLHLKESLCFSPVHRNLVERAREEETSAS